MRTLDFGGATVDRVVETEGPSYNAGFIFPDATKDAVAGERAWLLPHFVDPGSGRLLMSLFIGTLAYTDPAHAAGVRIDVLAGSLASEVLGTIVLRLATICLRRFPSAATLSCAHVDPDGVYAVGCCPG